MITERAENLLRVVVERYIRDGQPVGSKILAEESAMGLSSATIRNVLAELEDHGYLRSPHTSAGRVPTVQGYRFFVNTLLTTQQLAVPSLEQVKNQLTPDLDISDSYYYSIESTFRFNESCWLGHAATSGYLFYCVILSFCL